VGAGSETCTDARCREETSMLSSGAGAGVYGRLALEADAPEADAPEEGAEEEELSLSL
jgi:hypothetical protein